MAINPICNFCNEELEEPGGILCSPPDRADRPESVIKCHVCVNCFVEIRANNKELKRIKTCANQRGYNTGRRHDRLHWRNIPEPPVGYMKQLLCSGKELLEKLDFMLSRTFCEDDEDKEVNDVRFAFDEFATKITDVGEWLDDELSKGVNSADNIRKAKEDVSEHKLKTWPVFFEFVWDGSKKFEARRYDRDFKVNDIVELEEWDPDQEKYTGRWVRARISYLTQCKELMDLKEHALMSLDFIERGNRNG